MVLLRATVLVLALFMVGCHSTVVRSRDRPERGSSKSQETPGSGRVRLALDEFDARSKPKLAVSSAAFEKGRPIPATYSDYGKKSSPPLTIEGVPAAAKSIVVIVDDPDAAEPKPFVHWVLFDLPATTTRLRTAVPGTGQVRQLSNAKQGPNSMGSTGYMGPKPPIGDPPHRYHFQVFALDRVLGLEQGATKAEVIAAAKGHVLAAGELVGTFAKAK